MKTAIVTCNSVPNLTESDRKLLPLLRSRGIMADIVLWNDSSIDWKKYDLIIVRSIWDYHLNIDEFLKWLDTIESMEIKMLNNANIIKENHQGRSIICSYRWSSDRWEFRTYGS